SLSLRISCRSAFCVLSLHVALPISCDLAGGGDGVLDAGGDQGLPLGDLRRGPVADHEQRSVRMRAPAAEAVGVLVGVAAGDNGRSEEHTSELQSREKLVCRPLLEIK